MILTPEAQHANPELCRRLWELGVSRETAFMWERDYYRSSDSWSAWELHGKGNWGVIAPFFGVDDGSGNIHLGICATEIYPAYSVAELGELLKTYIRHHRCVWPLPLFFDCFIGWTNGSVPHTEFPHYPTEADARAALLIHIIEQERA